ncbi:hypothetical protein ACGFZP_13200 [Kitasatospora sp. NPDC048239]|uniref:hypothetical protein n=1 Tax=Kitasatospora sp. NPDC048239 TaxID=3364046 RepID=UPI003720D16C
MATRFWLTNSAAPYTPTTRRGAWDTASGEDVQLLGRKPAGSAGTSSINVGSTAADRDVLLHRSISAGAIKAGTISGTVSWTVGVRESNVDLNGFWHLHIYATSGDSDTPRGTLLADYIGSTEFTTTATGTAISGQAVTPVAIQVGDRLVVEIGYRANSLSTTYNATINYGNTGGTDLGSGDTAVTTEPGWVEFSGADGLFTPSFSTLTDTFTSSVDSKWTKTTNVSSSGGRARIPCTTTLEDMYTATAYEIQGSQVRFQVPTVPSTGGGSGVAFSAYLSAGPTISTTNLEFEYSPNTGNLVLRNSVGGTDASPTTLTYNSSTHAWWRFAESGGSITMDTSPDGTTWTTRRTISTPSQWMRLGTLIFYAEAQRSSGTADNAEIDNLNAAQTISLGTATETDTAQAIGRVKTRACPQSTATETALSPTAKTKTRTLSIAGSTETALAPAQPFANLVDDFSGAIDAGRWPASYGTYDTSAGHGRVACDTGFNGLRSGSLYTLTGSHVQARMWPPISAGASTATATLLVETSTSGTDGGFLIDSAAGAMGFYLRTGFSDPGAVFLSYDPTGHAWLRLREDAGTLYWETSPDGSTWTVRRSETTPGWASATDLSLLVESHRDAGSSTWTELDNVNILPARVIPVGTAQEAATAQTVTACKTLVLGTAGETGSAQSVGRRKSLTSGPAASVESALSPARLKARAVTAAAESGAAQSVQRRKTAALTPAASSEQALAISTGRLVPVGYATETSTAPAPGRLKRTPITPAGSTATALAPARHKTITLTAAASVDIAITVARGFIIPLGTAGETALALSPTRVKTRALSRATTLDLAVAVTVAGQHTTHGLRLTGGPTARWTVHGTTTAWACTGRTIPVDALSTEYYEVGVTWDRGIPTGYGVEMAIVPVGHEPAAGDWHAAAWDTASSGTGTVAKLLVGPAGVVVPVPGRYRAWVRVAATPELPVMDTAPFDIA